jgi:hypothetical protein
LIDLWAWDFRLSGSSILDGPISKLRFVPEFFPMGSTLLSKTP